MKVSTIIIVESKANRLKSLSVVSMQLATQNPLKSDSQSS